MSYSSIRSIIFGLSGKELQKEERDFFLQANPLGFILFSRNIESRDQVKCLTSSLRNLFPERKIMVFVDQEGGRVARIRPPLATKIYPAASFFADVYLEDKEKAKLVVRENYRNIMSELQELGIDSPCAPVCDIYYGGDKVIGDRAFGSKAEQVIDLCKEAIAGIHDKNGIAFIKHIPGHGRALADSHFTLPRVGADLNSLEETDFKVFKALANKDVWGMSAHIIYDVLDPSRPVTLSVKAIKYIREVIGFKGVLVTDDICMYALHGEISQIDDINQRKLLFCKSLTKATKESISAGCDVVLHCSGNLEEMRFVLRGYLSS